MNSAAGTMKILFLQAGGTIDKDYPSRLHGYSFIIDEPAANRILKQALPAFDWRIETVARKDSTDLNDDDRNAIAMACSAAEEEKVIVTHGTSTMVYTGKRIAQDLAPNKTVVVTGALLPEQFKQSDATFNIGFAAGVVQVLPPGVYVAMSGQVYPVDQVARDANGRFVPLDHPEAQAGDDPGIQLPA
eukprot:TRINITY_DN8790_c0_g2_i2.p1 TRINITY_DN8790_c0_g2~~TRINITY_DN8790_c0_g2_i2.p1  ORF type:complete len:188 (+),score=44.71 TRINITY_DN8790_c0_g2_i2:67-630(+)